MRKQNATLPLLKDIGNNKSTGQDYWEYSYVFGFSVFVQYFENKEMH